MKGLTEWRNKRLIGACYVRTDSEDQELEYRTCKKLADQSFSNGELAAGALTRCSNEKTE